MENRMVKNVCAPASVIDGKIYIIGGTLANLINCAKRILKRSTFVHFASKTFLSQAIQEEWWHMILKQTDLLNVRIWTKEGCITQPLSSTTDSMSLVDGTLTAMMMCRIQTALTAMTQRRMPGHQKALCHLNSLTMAQFQWCVSHISLFPHECDYNAAENSALCTRICHWLKKQHL